MSDTSKDVKLSGVPVEGLQAVARQFTHGNRKHGSPNWELGMRYSVVYDAMQRHALAWWGGEDVDEEGMPHLAAVAWGALVLLAYEAREVGTDDRPQLPTVIPGQLTFEEVQELGDLGQKLANAVQRGLLP